MLNRNKRGNIHFLLLGEYSSIGIGYTVDSGMSLGEMTYAPDSLFPSGVMIKPRQK
jgi:hypothetical protein